MANAASMAGMAFANAFLGVCHSMAHKLGAFYHLPHGVANAHMLKKYAKAADALKIGGESDEEKLEGLIKAVNELKEKVGIKKAIKDYGIGEEEFGEKLDEMTEQAFDDQCTGANPRYPLMSEIKQMYKNAYFGEHVNV